MPAQPKPVIPGQKDTRPKSSSSSESKAPRAWRVNSRALLILGSSLVIVTALGIAVWFAQGRRGRPALLIQAKRLAAKQQDDLALSYLRSYLLDNPKDFDALELRNEVLSRTARSPDQLNEAIVSGEAALRQISPIQTERGQKIRRRLIEAYLTVGPMVTSENRKYSIAETMAADLANITGTAADLRLHARVLERLATPAALERTSERLEQSRKLEPKDVSGAESLARLYIRLKKPAQADVVLEDLLKANPSPPAFLAAARFHALLADDAMTSGRSSEAPAHRAVVEAQIARAVKANPQDLDVRVEAARLAIDAKKPVEAALHLDQVLEKDRQDFRYLTYRGVIALLQNKTNDAVENWSRGLLNTGGSEADLTWRLAFVVLQLGQTERGEELIKQYRRLVGNPNGGSAETIPSEARYLEGLRFLKMNQPNKALKEFDLARLTIPTPLKAQFHLTMGGTCEAMRNESKALEEYSESIKADPKFSQPRIARARIYQSQGRLDDAVTEIKNGLEVINDDPTLLVTLARLEFDRQRRLPSEQRSWKEFNSLLERGRKAAPAAPALAVIHANALTIQGSPEAANDLLRKATAIDKTSVELWIARAEKEVQLNQLEEAVMVLDQAMDRKAAGDQAPFRILKAKILSYQGHGAEARESLVRDMESVPIDQRHRLYLALGELYLAQGDPKSLKSARKAFSDWAKMLPDDPLPRLFVLELAMSDLSVESSADVQDSLGVLIKSGGLYELIGRATYTMQKKSAKTETEAEQKKRLGAVEHLVEKIEAEAPTLRYGHLLRGELMRQRGDLPAAAIAFEKAMKTEGGRNLALPRLVTIYTEMGTAGKADLERLKATAPDVSRNIARVEAEAAARQGDKARAEKLALELVAQAEDNLEVRIWYARLLNTIGKPEEAEKALRTLVDKHSESLGPWMALVYFQVSRNDQKAAVKTVETMMASVKKLERPELVWGQAWRIAGERDRADAAFDAASERWPDDPRVSRAATEYYTASNRIEKAENIFRNVLKRDPDLRWAIRGLALILSSRPGDENAWQNAWDLIKQPTQGDDLPEDRLIRAVVLARGPEASNRDASTALLAKLVEDLPADLPAAQLARTTLVNTLIKTDPERAADYAAVDATGSTATPATISLHTSALIAAKKYEDASRQLDRLTSIAPEDAATITLRARFLRARGNGTEAAAALEQDAPIKINGPDGEAVGRHIVQTLMVELGQREAALRVADLLLQKFPKTAGVKAAVLAEQGKREDALKLYLEVIKEGDPANVREAARNSLALITRDKFDPASIIMAEKVIDAARLKDDKSSDLLAMAGYLRHFQGRYQDEIDIYEKAFALQPNDFTLLNNMAWTISEGLHKPEDALQKINEAINKVKVVPAHLYDTRGCIYTRLKQYDKAIRDLELATKVRPTGVVWAHLARAYKGAGKQADFERARDRAKNATPPLTPDMLEGADRAEIEPLIFGK